MSETEQKNQDVKPKIRQRYLGVNPELLDVIPAKPLEDIFASRNGHVHKKESRRIPLIFTVLICFLFPFRSPL